MFWQEKITSPKVCQPATIEVDFGQGKVPGGLWSYRTEGFEEDWVRSVLGSDGRWVDDFVHILSMDTEEDLQGAQLKAKTYCVAPTIKISFLICKAIYLCWMIYKDTGLFLLIVKDGFWSLIIG